MPLSPAEVPRLPAAVLELAARRAMEGGRGGRHRSPMHGPAVEFHDHRAYQPGDDLRHLDWRILARRDQMLTRRYREERSLPLLLVLDTSASMAWGEPAKLDYARICLAALALLAADQGDEVRICGGADGTGPIDRALVGPAAGSEGCRRLAALSAGVAGDPVRVLEEAASRLARRHLIILASDLLDAAPDRLSRALGAAAARGHEAAVLHVLDPAELSLPAAWGPCAITDPEGRSAAFSCDAAGAKAAYDRAITAHIEACRRAAAAARADLVLARTDEPAAALLGRWLATRRRRR